ncbi:TIGR01212 family radical SAM protein [Clostridium aminobutyricum]|uniref:TIGR01212 family radical SAM protein n=1 Tax=Clostridium aminobutyricum TaxID=33953 RepID=A0A939D737_CLOAM|nr:TIGR01212 family radical SAM protein [Clostridium aminobutyricum]MBN7772043.1 TIGR01212 family radical SAM protein [Clostridium aminobutyricum]
MINNLINQQEPINTIGAYLKKYFGQKTIKLSLEGGFTCPNRDGSKGTGGCIFCSADGSGDFASDIDGQIKLLSDKWPNSKHLAYFQSYSNTYAPVKELRETYDSVLKNPEISGIAIATRPDCITEETYELLSEINQKTFLWVELGLQTAHDRTADLINRCYTLDVYDEAIQRLSERNIRTVVHLILGLPGETKEEMLHSVRYVCQDNIFGIKLHLLNVVRGSQMEKNYPDYVPFNSMEEYISLVVDALEIIPPEITIHRMTADAPRPILISPEWSFQKRSILNGIHRELKNRGTWQGKKAREKQPASDRF